MKKEKETTKKEKPSKTAPEKKKKNTKIAEQKVELVEFSITAVIPTQAYGNIQPTITVKAPTVEIAVSSVMPQMEKIYEAYAENLPHFMREKIVVTERQVEPEVITDIQKAEPATPSAPKTDTVSEDIAKNTAPVSTNTYTPPKKADKVAGHPINSTEVPFGPSVKTEAYLKAENSIASASTIESLDLIQKKVNDSVKIDRADKPFLDTLILKKKKTIPLA